MTWKNNFFHHRSLSQLVLHVTWMKERVVSRYILHLKSWEFAFCLCQDCRIWTLIKPLQESSCTASQLEAMAWTIKAVDLRPIQQETDVHITSDVFRIPQMLPVPACLHAGKRSNKEVSLRLMIMPVLQASEGVVQHVLNIILKFSGRKYCGAFCAIKAFGFPCPHNV